MTLTDAINQEHLLQCHTETSLTKETLEPKLKIPYSKLELTIESLLQK